MNMNIYVDLAFKAIKTYLGSKVIISVPEGLPDEFYNIKSGVFVTIYEKIANDQKELRGCIGTYLPQRKNIAEEIIYNAISAATEDYRFNSLTPEDLTNIIIEVSVLDKPERLSDLKMLDAAKYGVIVSAADGRRGLLLPAIEGVNSPEEQIAIACQKGGIDPGRDKIMLHRFTVEKHIN